MVTDAHKTPPTQSLTLSFNGYSLIVPVVQGSLSHLEVGTGDALSQLSEQRHLHLLELGRLDDVEDLLQLVEKHDLLGAVDLGPEPEQTADDWLSEGGILLQELDHAVGQLGVIHGEGAHLVQRHQHLTNSVYYRDLSLFCIETEKRRILS